MFGRFARWLGRWAYQSLENDKATERLANREKLRGQPFPDHFLPHVKEVAQTAGLSAEQRAKLYRDIQVFLAEKKFVAIDDFPLDDRVRVIVATCASILVLGRDISLFDHVQEIRVCHRISLEVHGVYKPVTTTLGGEVFATWGSVELGWEEVDDGLAHPDGAHVAFHELAHAFDHADGELDALTSHEHFTRWSELLHAMPLYEYLDGDYRVIQLIGDTRGPELFAVASELFFECPRRLRELDKDLFDALSEIYALDPRTLTDR